MEHDELCPQAADLTHQCVCTLLRKARYEAKNELLHFFANEIMKLFLRESGR